MATRTPNFNLIKIELQDSPPDISVLGENFDIIDEELANAGGFVFMEESIDAANRNENKLYALQIRNYNKE